jgi:hypothetical protein
MHALASPRLQMFAEGVTAHADVGLPEASKQVGEADPPLLPLLPQALDSASKRGNPEGCGSIAAT